MKTERRFKVVHRSIDYWNFIDHAGKYRTVSAPKRIWHFCESVSFEGYETLDAALFDARDEVEALKKELKAEQERTVDTACTGCREEAQLHDALKAKTDGLIDDLMKELEDHAETKRELRSTQTSFKAVRAAKNDAVRNLESERVNIVIIQGQRDDVTRKFDEEREAHIKTRGIRERTANAYNSVDQELRKVKSKLATAKREGLREGLEVAAEHLETIAKESAERMAVDEYIETKVRNDVRVRALMSAVSWIRTLKPEGEEPQEADDKHDYPTCKHGQDPDVPLRAGCLPCLTTSGWEPIPVIEPPAPEPSEDDAQAVVDIERAGAAEAKEAEPKPKELRHMAFPKWCAKCARLNSETNACAYVCYFDPMRSSTPTQFLAMSKKEEPEEPEPEEEELREDNSAWCPDCQNHKHDTLNWLNCSTTCAGGKRINGKVAKPGSFVLRTYATCDNCAFTVNPSPQMIKLFRKWHHCTPSKTCWLRGRYGRNPCNDWREDVETGGEEKKND